MQNFIGNPKTLKLEAVNGDPGTGLYSYRYDEEKVSASDLTQILNITEIILGDIEEAKYIFEPVDTKNADVFLSIKHRQNIKIGRFRLMRS